MQAHLPKVASNSENSNNEKDYSVRFLTYKLSSIN